MERRKCLLAVELQRWKRRKCQPKLKEDNERADVSNLKIMEREEDFSHLTYSTPNVNTLEYWTPCLIASSVGASSVM